MLNHSRKQADSASGFLIVLNPSFPSSAYFHVPFCQHRCGYCDFTLVAQKDHLIEAYLDAMAKQMSELGEGIELKTLFLGGGTPTHLSIEQLSHLFESIFSHFRLAADYEFSIEANPLNLTSEKIEFLKQSGVNRVSLGVQSFDSEILTFLERDHQPDQIFEIVKSLQSRISNTSLDLIFAVPGQSLAGWKQTLQNAVQLNIPHISTYGLTIEKGTSFWSREKAGLFDLPQDDLAGDMYEYALEFLDQAGLQHYEISNFARPGYECRHNEVYWTGYPYFGFGPGAASYLDGIRRQNHRSVITWLKRVQAGESPIVDQEELEPEARAREAIIFGLRRRAGINRREFQERYGFDLHQLAETAIRTNLEAGLLEETDTHLKLTSAGCLLADSIVVDFL
ncbi:coproporphyrinogen III oxidase [Gimesia maris DSM 8797]|uniref:Heme chaperone HemW n=3 Tax=Gimesia maris TaxID=122 RepID=A0ABX5YS57_9PLAN|nr:coproporphyrinogen III oxidase [Gimesia maris DSM 8797]QDT80817.1 Oxygen-independent coproporphyrinogen-III oxidase-like protein [Gimesia maris]QEG18574.1 Oxygen-independent coproporphyrinogen-III oxidase-like protein [Gimesia maris]QGQ32582.1 radical SAM family heme chaperone HemW [Gimesia maris]|tara:strand:- start:114593 stop:115777 length:1185 start_codon:yes stop_codon:yes gene_type:complete